MTRLRLALFRTVLAAAVAAATLACGRAASAPGPDGTPAPSVPRDQRTPSFDPTTLFRQMGMIARGQPFPVVGRIGVLPSAETDRAHVIVALGFAPFALRFNRETDDRFRASYSVNITAERDGLPPVTMQATQSVILTSFRETERTDESLLFQEILDLAPGRYRVSISLRDLSSQRGLVEVVELTVPDFALHPLAPPVPVNRVVPRETRDSLPFILVRPRATASVGQDSVLPMYIESADPADSLLTLVARGESGRVLWEDRVRINGYGAVASGIVQVPVQRLGIGVSQLSFVGSAGADTSSAFVYVGFGDDLPIARFEDMLQFLRFFARPYRLQALREASEEQRPAAWASFLRETDSIPSTPVHEDLRSYFGRLVRANTRFREDGLAGWSSDRGKVFLVLGEPDQIIEPPFTNISRARQQVWEYNDRGLQLQFFDQSGAGRWRLTQASEVRFDGELRRFLR